MVRKFSDMMCGNLEDASRQQLAMRQRHHLASDGVMMLERIRGKDGCTTREPTEKQRSKGRTVGTAVNGNCYACRKYLTEKGEVVYRQTTFCCSTCKMPICKESQECVKIGRNESCFDEHRIGADKHTRCGQHKSKQQYPREGMINLHTKKITSRTRKRRR